MCQTLKSQLKMTSELDVLCILRLFQAPEALASPPGDFISFCLSIFCLDLIGALYLQILYPFTLTFYADI